MRIPRPHHLTNLSIQYNKYKEEQVYKSMVRVIVQTYLTNNFRLNNQFVSLIQISQLYNIPPELVQQNTIEVQSNLSSFLTDGDLLGSHERLLGMVFAQSAEDRAYVATQLQSLLKSQGDSYKPFISSTVNQAIKLMLESTKNLSDIADKLIPKNSEMVNLIVEARKSESLTANDAISLIRQEALKQAPTQRSLPPGSQDISPLNEIYIEQDMANMPNVQANQADEAANINVKAKKIIENPQTLKDMPKGDRDDYDIQDVEEVE